MSFFTLGLYQLENLILARPSFRFLDVRLNPQIVSLPRVQAIIAQARVVSSARASSHLEAERAGKDEPIILLCEDGRLSTSTALALEREGYRQLYIVEGGLDGLLREAASSL